MPATVEPFRAQFILMEPISRISGPQPTLDGQIVNCPPIVVLGHVKGSPQFPTRAAALAWAVENGIEVTPEDTGFRIGEERHSSAGNVYRLEWHNETHCGVRRISNGTDCPLWDADIVYRWMNCQWESLPLVGETSDDPSFGLFIPR